MGTTEMGLGVAFGPGSPSGPLDDIQNVGESKATSCDDLSETCASHEIASSSMLVLHKVAPSMASVF